MPNAAVRAWLAGLSLVCAAFVADAWRADRHRVHAASPNLEVLVPAQLGRWRIDSGPPPVQPNAALQAKVERLYDRTLARTYVDDEGRRVMLVVAYGADQSSDALQAHRPEYCYQAQGFSIRAVGDARLPVESGALPVRRLVAERPDRHEPITYWMMVGHRAVLPGWERKLAQLRSGLDGAVPDGFLVRVSSLDRDAGAGHAAQEGFILDLLAALEPPARRRLTGVDIRPEEFSDRTQAAERSASNDRWTIRMLTR